MGSSGGIVAVGSDLLYHRVIKATSRAPNGSVGTGKPSVAIRFLRLQLQRWSILNPRLPTVVQPRFPVQFPVNDCVYRFGSSHESLYSFFLLPVLHTPGTLLFCILSRFKWHLETSPMSWKPRTAPQCSRALWATRAPDQCPPSLELSGTAPSISKVGL